MERSVQRMVYLLFIVTAKNKLQTHLEESSLNINKQFYSKINLNKLVLR